VKETEDAMRDADEQWVADLAARSQGLVPDVPVDVAAALRGGRRRRTQRRVVGGGALFAVVVGARLGIPALERPTTLPGVVETAAPTLAPTPDRPYAEVVDTIPACRIGANVTSSEPTPEWQSITDRYVNHGVVADDRVDPDLALDASEPTPGAVPLDFVPVAVVTCRDATPADSPFVVEAPVRLEGDLGPLLDFLAQPEPVAPGLRDPQCVLDYELMPPQLYLLDAAGRAIAPHWPSDNCGRAAEQGFPLLDALDAVALWGLSEDGSVVTDAALADGGAPPVAEILDAVPACHDLGRAPSGLPSPGAVPPDFEPVLVAYCDDKGVAGWDQQMLEGDLRPLIAFLAQPPAADPSMGGCTYQYEFPPQVYLVDRDGRAIAPHWPSDGCAHPAPEGEALLDALDEVSAFDEVTKLAP